MKPNHEPLDHAILVLTQMEIDLHRIAIQSNEAQGGLINDCAEHRIAMLNKLRHIKQQWGQDEAQKFVPLDRALGRVHRQPESIRISAEEITSNAMQGAPAGDPEIAPEPQSKREPSALAEYRRRSRWAHRLAWIIAAAGAFAIITAIRFAFKNL
jgi:hypothetical protein